MAQHQFSLNVEEAPRNILAWEQCKGVIQVGFMTVDALARREGVRVEKLQHKSTVARCSVAGQRVLLAKPMTYMNLSGESIVKLAKFYKV